MGDRSTLEVELVRGDDGWPPFEKEALTVENDGDDFRVVTPPVFVRLSVGDTFRFSGAAPTQADLQTVGESDHTLVWLLAPENIVFDELLARLKGWDCLVSSERSCGVIAVDVPRGRNLTQLEAMWQKFVELGELEVAYPILRHASDG